MTVRVEEASGMVDGRRRGIESNAPLQDGTGCTSIVHGHLHREARFEAEIWRMLDLRRGKWLLVEGPRPRGSQHAGRCISWTCELLSHCMVCCRHT